MKKKNMMGHLAALITIIIWGTTFISTKVLLVAFAPVEILIFRFGIGLVALMVAYPKKLPKTGLRQELLFAAAGLCGVTLYFLLENIALTYTYASNVGVIISVAPFFTALLANKLLDGEGLHLQFFAGFAAAIAGIGLISFSGSGQAGLNPFGDLLAAGAAVVWAFYSILTRKISEYGYHTIQTTRRIFLYGLVLMLPATALFQFQWEWERFANPVYLINMLFLGLGASALCFVSWNFAVAQLGAVKTSVYIYLVPVVTIATSFIVLGEAMTMTSFLGAGLIVAGLVLSEQKKKMGA